MAIELASSQLGPTAKHSPKRLPCHSYPKGGQAESSVRASARLQEDDEPNCGIGWEIRRRFHFAILLA